MHIYAFGSVCRGDIDLDSDIDVLALTDRVDHRFDPLVFSIYSYSRIRELWNNGNPFAWHLHLESKLLFSSTGDDFIAGLGVPKEYKKAASDCATFMEQCARATVRATRAQNTHAWLAQPSVLRKLFLSSDGQSD